MGLAFLRLPHAQTKWRLKLLSAYKDKHESDDAIADDAEHGEDRLIRHQHESRKGKGGKMILFGLPLITVLREGLEGVVFLGGIGLSESPPAVAGGAFFGLVIGSCIGESTVDRIPTAADTRQRTSCSRARRRYPCAHSPLSRPSSYF